ncbi:MAG: S9 family peptidase [Solibacillus sp.]
MKLTKEHLVQIQSVANPVLSPNEAEAVFVRTMMNKEENTYNTHLFHVDLATEAVTQWTFGNTSVKSVQWSPDGETVAFLQKIKDVQQVFSMSRRGGEPQQVTDFAAGVSGFLWHPCSTKLWLEVEVAEGVLFGEKPIQDAKFPQVYEVPHLKYKQDGLSGNGLKQPVYKQIACLTIGTKAVEVFTKEAVHHTLQAISHDGTQLVIAKQIAEQQADDFSTTLMFINTETKTQTVFLQADGAYGQVAYSLDDRYIAYVGHDATYKNATQNDLYVYDRETAWTNNVTIAMDMHIGDAVIGDVQQGTETPVIHWTELNDLYCQASVMGDVRLYYVTLDGAVYPASPEDEHVYSYDVFRSGNMALATISNPTFIGELFVLDITTGERRQLTHFNEELQKLSLSTPEQIIFARDGFTMYGWLLKPVSFEEDEKYPLIVNIHGGPHAMYGNTFFHEMQLLAAEGYGVLYMNPRGSHGYSQAFVDAVRGDYGGGDYADILAALDEAIAQEPWIDRERLGVMGGSYGGFMTNWIVGHSDRFKAAVTLRSISNWTSFYGVSDIGYYFTEWQIGADMQDVDKLWQQSPLKYAQSMNTPLLILHSEEDFRCPIEQAEQLYVTLKRMGKDVSFVRFPKSNHNMSRTGIPSLRQERLNYIINWFAQYLLVG